MLAVLVTAALIASALVLTLLAPGLLPRWTLPRRAPAAGLLLWQAVSLAGVVCALLAAPVAALTIGLQAPTLLGMAIVVSALMLGRVLWSGHRVGTDLRRRRDQHRLLVDLVGERLDGAPTDQAQAAVRATGHPVAVLAQASPTAYCLPGRDDRIVLSQAALDRLDQDGLAAVLAHERAHLTHRHDLLLELFTVLHEAVPSAVRAPAALREVHLLAEALADRSAASRTGAPSLARALVALAMPAEEGPPLGQQPPGLAPATSLQADGSTYPDTAVAAGHQVHTRLRLLAAPPPPAAITTALAALALAVALLPVGLLVALLL